MPAKVQRFEVAHAEEGARLDKFLAERLVDFSRTQLQNLIKERRVQVNGKSAKSSYHVESGDWIEAEIPSPIRPTEVLPQTIPLTILYEDEHLAVINKPAGLVVHLGPGNESGTLVNALLAHWKQVAAVGDIKRAGIVHRLDKDTSGVILVALTPTIQRKLMEQFQARTIQKTYLALVDGHPRTPTGRIETPIGRDSQDRKKMAVSKPGREAITVFRELETYRRHSLLELDLLTGRTHQIRVHLSFIGCPVVGDQVYGYGKPSVRLDRLFLHAEKLVFTHPITGETITVEADLPGDLQTVLAQLSR